MSNKHLDDFLESFNPSDDLIHMKDEILDRTYKKIDPEPSVVMRMWTLRNVLIASVLMILLSGLIPSTPVNALYHSVFQRIPGYGVIETDDDYYIQAASSDYVRIEEGDSFFEVRYAYIAEDYLNISAVSNAQLSHISNPDDKEAVLDISDKDDFGRLYMIIDGESVDMQGGSVAIGSGAGYTSKGNFYLEGDQKNIRTFEIGVIGMTQTAVVTLHDVSSSEIPEALGSSLIIDDMIVFADLERVDDIAIVTISIITPQSKKNASIYMHEYEEEFYNTPVVIRDEAGQLYYSDRGLRRQNIDDINRFYFEIPAEAEQLELMIPMILYTETYNSRVEVMIPNENRAVSLNESVVAGKSQITIEELVYLPKGHTEISDEFSEWPRIMIKSHSEAVGETDEKVIRVRYHAFKKSMFEYEEIYFSAYGGLWPLEKQSGEFIFPCDEVDEKKLMLDLEIEKALLGPFVIELNE